MRNPFKLIRFQLVWMLLSLCAGVCQAQVFGFQTDGVAWKSECVGLYQVDLPADFQPLVRTVGSVVGDYVSGSDQVAELPVASGSNVTIKEFYTVQKKLHDAYISNKKNALDEAKNAPMTDAAKERQIYGESISAYPISDINAFAWRDGPDSIDGYFYRAGRIYSISGPPKGKASPGEPNFEEKVKLFRPRELFEIPTGEGLCLPFSFIGTTFRGRFLRIYQKGVLAKHPDIMIWVGDGAWWDRNDDASDFRLSSGENKKKSRDSLRVFWEQLPREREMRTLVWPFPSVKMADYEGYSSFIQITRQNGDVDYGYRAVANPQGGYYALDIHLIQRSEVARQRNLTPMSKEEFKRLADEVVASLRKRE